MFGGELLQCSSFQFDLLEQLGFEGYAILVNTAELQTHLLATSKGKAFHRAKQLGGKPLENPFIGYVFTDDSGEQVNCSGSTTGPQASLYPCVHDI